MPKPDDATFVRGTLSPHYGAPALPAQQGSEGSGGVLTAQQDACLRNISKTATLIRWVVILLPLVGAAVAAGLVWVLRDSRIGDIPLP